jgi:branched-chain amino acid transport system ATP-binding protein
MSTSNDIILETRGLTKEFKGFVAVSDVSLKVRRGTIHALIGPNGAGKTTCFNLLTKFLAPTRGQIFYNGQDITSDRPAQIARPASSARSRSPPSCTRCWRTSRRTATGLGRRSSSGAERTLNAEPARWSCSDGEALVRRNRRLLLIRKRALKSYHAGGIGLMLLDEPTQGMGHEDVARVTALIKKVSANRTILMVEHNMSVVSSIADTITVLQRGQVIAEGPYEAVSKNPQVMEAYMGTVTAELRGAHG